MITADASVIAAITAVVGIALAAAAAAVAAGKRRLIPARVQSRKPDRDPRQQAR